MWQWWNVFKAYFYRVLIRSHLLQDETEVVPSDRYTKSDLWKNKLLCCYTFWKMKKVLKKVPKKYPVTKNVFTRMANTIVLFCKVSSEYIIHWHNVKKHCFVSFGKIGNVYLRKSQRGSVLLSNFFSCVTSHDKVSQRGRPIISFLRSHNLIWQNLF